MRFAVCVFRGYRRYITSVAPITGAGTPATNSAERQREWEWTIPAPRGTIVDALGLPLAHSQPVWHLFRTDWVHDKLYAIVALASVLGRYAMSYAVLDGTRNGVVFGVTLTKNRRAAQAGAIASVMAKHLVACICDQLTSGPIRRNLRHT